MRFGDPPSTQAWPAEDGCSSPEGAEIARQRSHGEGMVPEALVGI